jgi:hypothetical protein
MGLDDFIITCVCLIDEALPTIIGGKRLRQAGPQPKVSDSEVITIEVVGSYLGLTQDKALYESFRRHYSHFFPALSQIDRTRLGARSVAPAQPAFARHTHAYALHPFQSV